MNFSQFNLKEKLLKGIDEAGYSQCTAIQEKTLTENIINHRDIYAQSQTGTGKTAAFLIPTFENLLQNPDNFALIIVPTRELATQVEKEASVLGKYLKLKMVAVYGGMGYDQQERALAQNPRLIVGTPGRLIDFSDKGLINLKKASVLVIDEADRLFDMGFVKDVKYLMSKMKVPKERLSMLFSATLNAKVGNLAWEYMNNPASITIEAESVTVNNIEQVVFHIARAEKLNLLLALLKTENPYSAVIFSNTKSGAGYIATALTKAGYQCALIEGNVPQRKRMRIIADVKSGKTQFLAATDVAARGLHVPNLTLVINYDLPEDHENYVHRIGRTARAGQSGKAYSFACERFVYNLSSIEKYIGKKITVRTITPELEEAMAEVKKELKQKPATTPVSAVATPKKTIDKEKPNYQPKSRPNHSHSHNRDEHRRSHERKEGKKNTARSYPNNRTERSTPKGNQIKTNQKRSNPKTTPKTNLVDKKKEGFFNKLAQFFTKK